MIFRIKKRVGISKILSDKELNIIRILKWFHRDDLRFISFAHKVNGKFTQIGSIRCSALDKSWNRTAAFVKKDGYFTINDFHSAKSWLNQKTRLPGVKREERNVHNLNVCYVDLDIGRRTTETGEVISISKALEILQELVLERKIPRWSGWARSGRGVYVFWRLANPMGRPVHAIWQTRIQYRKVQRALVSRLGCLASDQNAMDSSRVLRVPGTRHSVSGREAKYYLHDDPIYTLEFLAKFLGIGKPVRFKKVDSKRKNLPACKKGFLSLNLQRAQDLLKLEAYRGGFHEGTRRRAIRYYIQFLRAAGVQRRLVFEEAATMASRCKPPYPTDGTAESVDELANGVFCSEKNYRYSNQTIVGDLHITDRECLLAGLKTILTVERRNYEENRREAKRMLKCREKNRLEQLLRRRLGKRPDMSGRQITDLCQRHGIKIHRQTALRWKKRIIVANGIPLKTS